MNEGLLLAQNYDGNKSGDGDHLSTATAMQTGLNGGSAAVLTWAFPLVVALIIAVLVGARWRSGHRH